MSVAYLSPFWNHTNRLTEIHKTLLAANGYEVRPFSTRTILSPAGLGLFARDNVVLVSWMESRPFKKRGGRIGLDVFGLLHLVFYLVVLRMARARVFYFVHDHALHDTEGRVRAFSSWVIRCLARTADVRVVHDPSYCERYDAVYLPHPLYWEYRPAANVAQRHEDTHAQRPVFKALGAIKPYKGLDRLLSAWPHGVRLEIKGRADEEYLSRLHRIIEQRGLQADVVIEPRFLSEDEFDVEVATTDVMLMPHVSESMLVSGAFFEAAGRVPAMLARRTPFMAWAATVMPGIELFANDDELPGRVMSIAQRWTDRANAAAARQAALDFFGRQCCEAAYGALLREGYARHRALAASPAAE